MEKTCISIITHDFQKSLAKLGAEGARKIIETISHLEEMENDRTKIPHGRQSAESVVGDRLTVLNKNTFALKTKNYDRALAIVQKIEGKKVYIWYWAGTHEEYNKELKPHKLSQSERLETAKQSEVIAQKIRELSSPVVAQNIENIRNKNQKHKSHKHVK